VKKSVVFTLNGHRTDVEIGPGEPLLYVLRDRLELDGPKFGCGLGQCGACTVILDGTAIRSCVYPAEAASGAHITTVEGLGDAAHPHPVQSAFIAEQAAQCGYCTNGMIMSATALLRKNPKPSIAQIKTALAGNLCRCACQLRVVRAVQRVARS
jgi:nicotinate dehydrogenase subunit A